MAASHPDAGRLRVAAALIASLAAVASAESIQVPRPSKEQPIDLVAASSEVDYKNNTLKFTQVVVTQGPLKVEAQQATSNGLNFQNSEWTLTGAVTLTTADGKLTADKATLTFANNQLARAVATGAPAEFEQQLQESKQIVKGHAQTIDYDLQANTVRLTGMAWLADPDNEIHGDTLVYDIATQHVAANPGGSVPGGVHMIINPKKLPGGKGSTKTDQDKPKNPPNAPDKPQ